MNTLLNLLVKSSLLVMLLSGCIFGDNDSNQPSPAYVLTIEEQYSVAAGEQITLNAEFEGAENGESLLWSQIHGKQVEFSTNADGGISFIAPQVSADILKFEVSGVDSLGHPIIDQDGNPIASIARVDVTGASFVLDVTDGLTHWWEVVDSSHDQYVAGANDDTHTADNVPGGTLSFLVNDKAGFYDLYVRYLIPENYGKKVARVIVNGKAYTEYFSATSDWETIHMGTIRLLEGDNQIIVGGGHNYYRIDELSLVPATPPEQPLVVKNELANVNASLQAKLLMQFLIDNYGIHTVAGQMDNPIIDGEDVTFAQIEIIKSKMSGSYSPGILGFDMISYSSTYGDYQSELTEVLVSQYKKGKVVLAPKWTWNAPSGNTSDSKGYLASETDFDLSATLADPNSSAYQAIVADIDLLAAELTKFAEQNVPLIWQPLPQADSAEYWWGTAGAEAVKSLWQLMYKRLVEHHQLNNLIWVFGFSEQVDLAFYPGNEFVDIVALEAFDGKNQQALFNQQYDKLKQQFDGQKLLALAATGTVPDLSYLHENKVFWSYFLTSISNEQDFGPDTLSANQISNGYHHTVPALSGEDVPGFVYYTEPGLYLNFDDDGSFEREFAHIYSLRSTFDVLVDWALQNKKPRYSSEWSSDGDFSLVFNVEHEDEFRWSEQPKVAIEQQVNTHLKGVSSIGLTVNALGAGGSVTARIYVRYGSYERWLDSGSVAVVEGGAEINLELNDVQFLHSWGVLFEGIDSGSSEASFFIDSVEFK